MQHKSFGWTVLLVSGLLALIPTWSAGDEPAPGTLAPPPAGAIDESAPGPGHRARAALRGADAPRPHWAHLGAGADQWARTLPAGARHGRQPFRRHRERRGSTRHSARSIATRDAAGCHRQCRSADDSRRFADRGGHGVAARRSADQCSMRSAVPTAYSAYRGPRGQAHLIDFRARPDHDQSIALRARRYGISSQCRCNDRAWGWLIFKAYVGGVA